jgi:hypothetical protein
MWAKSVREFFCCVLTTADRPHSPPHVPQFQPMLIILVIVSLTVITVLVGVLFSVARKRVSAPTWFPEGFRFNADQRLNREGICTPK